MSRPFLRVLGSFELRIPLTDEASTTAPLGVDEHRLLALLAVSTTARTTRDLAAVLWPGRTADAALGTLQGVCDALGQLVTEADGTLRLSDDVDVDLARALARLRAWRRDPFHVESTTPDELVGLLGEDLLPGWTEDWAAQERERFRRVRLHALESLCQRLTAAGRFGPAIAAGLRVVEADAMKESARRALIEAHLAAGNVSEAVRLYDEFTASCSRLGLAPGTELTALFPPSPAWPVLHVRRPINFSGTVGRGFRTEPPARRAQVGVGPAARG
ncbi:MAG TPA: bacterial transcriptional activator domain-containing protein [Pseudonocardia sp.]